jgi:hypothetical protein
MLRRRRNLHGYCAYGCCGPHLPARVERRRQRRREAQVWRRYAL